MFFGKKDKSTDGESVSLTEHGPPENIIPFTFLFILWNL